MVYYQCLPKVADEQLPEAGIAHNPVPRDAPMSGVVFVCHPLSQQQDLNVGMVAIRVLVVGRGWIGRAVGPQGTRHALAWQ
jgi:hypothetical protein